MSTTVDPRALEPTGTVQELEELNLPTETYRSCAEPSPDRKVAGCAFWNICQMPYKGLHQIDEDGRQVGGPHHHGVYIVAPSGAALQDVRSCFQYIQLAPETIQSGGVFEIIADEGEEIVVKGTRAVPVAKGSSKLRAEPFTKTEAVPYFKRPSETFHEKVYEMKIREAVASRENKKRREIALGYKNMVEEAADKASIKRPKKESAED
jgi:hypothetical protein